MAALPTSSTVAPSAAAGGRPLWATVKSYLESPFYRLYQRRLEAQMAGWRLPRHIGIIMDGNRRYARNFGNSPVSFGHYRGAEKLWQVLNWCYEAEIPVVTVWSFSLDNFHRDTSE
ncbi:MAG TPA: undecaprenyl diphosphate synthase family protein, partial [Thermoanaerobaculia bacterium]|nr:undecaprenyl diphosphate synthase family protein [Thermoanaerobaculia bacterium]